MQGQWPLSLSPWLVFSTEISTRAAFTLWYHSVRPSESVVECSGLPTRSRAVSEFMIGLEKTKARQGVYFDIDLGTCKNAQTGISQWMCLCANDKDPKICPKWALIRLAALYGENHDCTRPLFLVINKNGAVTTQPLVAEHENSLANLLLPLAEHLQETYRALDISPGYYMGHTHSAEGGVNTAFEIKAGPLVWLLHGVAGHKLKQSPCSDISTPPMTIMNT
ncbi:uncharacterized protein F5147DRAFT_647203 [Suillus discolor]|uniref:Uncharacterized protein n=1 Tax=Suillus discolor TaxID=1912936 RepID=A0A9P7FKP9_9AGAM|nr:uncharacterized protein F5147DRAFT_647203 [Suillus discolor]KAG2120776.1 hypothetical protein F5147DRAFT_647203 [Suillus discolor]